MMHKIERSYIIPISIATVVSIITFASVILFIDPYSAPYLPNIFFYSTLFLSLVGIFTIISMLVRRWFEPTAYIDRFRISVRQATLVALMLCALILLQSLNLLFWWVGLTLIMFITMLEIFFNA
jgi:hypothetical protein